MSIVRCQKYICATSTFDAKSPLASTELLFEVPSLRVMCNYLRAKFHVFRRRPAPGIKIMLFTARFHSIRGDTPHGTPRKLENYRSQTSIDEIVWNLACPARNQALSTIRISRESHDIAIPNKKHRFSIPRWKFDLHAGPWPPIIFSKTNFLALLAVTSVFLIKNPSKLWGVHQFSQV